ncbi:carbohydrate ABC transporter permease [Bacillus sp. SA1-12]|uniref:carbohydrate ABC transporter permease n=1 Tax=Bacillus sp. SA1-12 TaxID=1455638 RepID=UPI0006983E1B|nr:sugar ABC transporter permease [Bacillus sp. SA1-12]
MLGTKKVETSTQSFKITNKKRKITSRLIAPWLFMAPAILIVLIFVAVPAVTGLGLSFFKYDGINPPNFTGLKNYAYLLNDELFLKSILVTVYYVVGSLIPAVAISLAIAIVLNKKWFPFKNIIRATYFLPTIVSMVAVAFVWKWLFNPQFGPVNEWLSSLGFPNQQFFGDPLLAMPMLIIIGVWKAIGFNMVIYLAGLQGIDKSYYEAAEIDGASSLQQFWFITWPLLIPTTFFVVTMGVIGGFQIFDQIFIITGGGPAQSTYAIVFYIYQKAFEELTFGYSSSLSMILFIIILVITLIQYKYMGKVQY